MFTPKNDLWGGVKVDTLCVKREWTAEHCVKILRRSTQANVSYSSAKIWHYAMAGRWNLLIFAKNWPKRHILGS